MKKLSILVVIGATLFTFCLFMCSCKIFDPCDPGNIQSGKSSEHHDQKKMRASASPHIEKIRVMWIHQDGPVFHVRYANMKTIEPRVYFEQLPSDLIIEGTWIPVDSLCSWDHRSDSIAKL